MRPGAIDRLGRLLADGRISAGGDVAVAVGPGQGEDISARLAETLPPARVFSVEGGTVEAARDLADELRRAHYDALVGIGGGKTLDAAKYAASQVGLPFVAVATNLAHDGLASPVASLDSVQGRKVSFGVQVPIAVFVDIDFVRAAPVRHVRSGIGDVLSNLSAVADWELAERERGEEVDGLAVALSRNAAEALLGLEDDGHSEHYLTTVAESLIASGLAMTVAGSSRPCSGACHEIGHALDAFFGSPGSHGEQVAVGALFATWLRGDERLGQLDASLRRLKVPRLPSDLGLEVEDFVQAVVRAPETRPGRFTILEHLALDEPAVREQVHAFVETLDR